MAIASLKRYAADHFDREEDWNLSCKEENGKKCGSDRSRTIGITGST